VEITLNLEKKLYVLRHPSGGYTCFGFDNCFRDAVAMAERMNTHRLSSTTPIAPPDASLHGTIECHQIYQQLLAAWAKHPASKKTWYDPRTPNKVTGILEKAIQSHRERAGYGQRLRLFLGDPATGSDWCEENDVVGFIGRSCGSMKVPLLLEPLRDEWGDRMSAESGGAILTANILRIIDIDSLEELYRAKNYKRPDLTLEDSDPRLGYPFEVQRDGQVVARFRTRVDAEEYVAFIRGHRVSRTIRTVGEYREEMRLAA